MNLFIGFCLGLMLGLGICSYLLSRINRALSEVISEMGEVRALLNI